MTPTLSALPRIGFAAAVALSLAGCSGTMSSSGAATDASAARSAVVQARLLDASGKDMGFVRLTPTATGMEGNIQVMGIAPGPHGMHIHTVGKCDAPDFQTAGGHLNPTAMKHGLSNPAGPHQGDLPQLIVGADGTASQSFAAGTTLAALLDADGASFIVHAGPDDQMTDPTGNSGGRILCGVLTTTATLTG